MFLKPRRWEKEWICSFCQLLTVPMKEAGIVLRAASPHQILVPGSLSWLFKQQGRQEKRLLIFALLNADNISLRQ